MKLYEFEFDNLILAIPPFDSSEWYLSIAPMLQKNLFLKYSDRDVIETARIRHAMRDYADGKITEGQFRQIVVAEIQTRIQYELYAKNRAYTMMYRAIMEEFDPLWNVDGTETLTYTRDNTGTQTNVHDEDGTNTGTQTNTDTTSNTSTDSTTTYDSSTWKDTNKNVSSNSGAITRSDDLSHTLDTTDTRTDALTETYTETKKRGGNIGVTKSQELLQSTLDVFGNLSFLDIVAHDIANVITCRTY